MSDNPWTDIKKLWREIDILKAFEVPAAKPDYFWVNVLNYGAKGDGITDDSAAIQAAINSIGTYVGGGVLFPPGKDYLICSTINIINRFGITWEGIGWGNPYSINSRLRWGGAAGGTMINVSGAVHCTFKHLAFFGDNAAYQTNNTNIGVHCQSGGIYYSSNQVAFEECYWQNWGICVNMGVGATESVDPWFFNRCRMDYGDAGVGIKSNSSNNTRTVMNECTFNAPPGGGGTSIAFYCIDGGFRMTNCLTQGNAYGIYHTGSSVPCELINHHSEVEGWPIYYVDSGLNPTLVMRYALSIVGMFTYQCVNGWAYFADPHVMYTMTGSWADSTDSEQIVVPTGYESMVHLRNVSQLHGTDIINVAAAATTVNGWYGTMGTVPDGERVKGNLLVNGLVEVGTGSTFKAAINPDGGFMVRLTNKTGGNSVKGHVVSNSATVANAVEKILQNEPDPIGVFYESGIADGAEAWIVVSGIADVYFTGSTTLGYFARGFVTADGGAYVIGQAMSENIPTSPFATDKHFYEIGHVLEARVGAGLAKCVIHFN
jgi:hypothetical protein